MGEILADDLAPVGRRNAAQHVLAGGIVRPDQVQGLDALLVHVVAHRLRRLVVLPGGREEEWRAQTAGDLVRTGIGADQEGLRVDHRLERGQQHVRPDVAGDEIDPVGLDQLLGLLPADVRAQLVVLVDDLDRQPAHLAAEWSSANSNELRMSLPITAVGPLNVLTKPIFTLSAAQARASPQDGKNGSTGKNGPQHHRTLPDHTRKRRSNDRYRRQKSRPAWELAASPSCPVSAGRGFCRSREITKHPRAG